MKNQIKVCIAAVCLSLVIVPHTFAFDGGEGRQKPMAMKMFKQLDLSDAQKAEIKSLRIAARENASLLKADRKEVRSQIESLMSKPAWDETLALTIIESNAELMQQKAVNRAKLRHDIYQVLSTEQRTQLDALKAEKMTQKDTTEGKKRKKKRGDMLSKRMAKKLNLSDEQKAEIKALRESAKTELLAFKDDREEFKTSMKALVQADIFDEDAVIGLLESNSDKRTAAKLIRLETRYNVLTVLSDEQKAKLEKMKQKRMKKIMERRSA